MQLPLNMTTASSLFNQLGHRRVAQVTIVLLLIYIAFVSAEITWSLVPQSQDNQLTSANGSANSSRSKKANNAIDVTKIQSLNLFGLYSEADNVKPEVEMSDVPETKLNLTLSGLVASNDPLIAAAVIENRGKQETYGVGEMITGTRANLEQVLMDRVLIKQSGKLETLMLDGFDYSQPVEAISTPKRGKKRSTASNRNVTDVSDNKALSERVKSLRDEISKDPAKISDYISISPRRDNGEIIGYALRPGKEREFFKLSGLKAGDVAVQMNGYNLIEPAEAMQAMAEMKQARDFSLLVDRGGELTEIQINLE